MNIVIVGVGYVGLSNATLLAQKHHVTAVDVLPEKVEQINRKQSPIADIEIEEYLTTKKLDLTATIDGNSAYKDADYVIIATPTNYDPVKNYFDTSSVETVLKQVLEFIDKKLSKREKYIMNKRYGLDGSNSMTQQELADELGISRSYVSRIETKVQKLLKKNIKR